MILRTGKASDRVLDRSVYKRLGRLRAEEAADPGPSESSAVRCTSDAVTLRTAHVGMLSVTAAVNNLAAGGIRPERLRTDILLPVGTEETCLRNIEDEIREAAARTQAIVTGGHTEVTSAVTRPVVVTQAMGWKRYFPGIPESLHDSAAGADIVVIGQAGLEGTFLLAGERKGELERHFPKDFLRHAEQTGGTLMLTPILEMMSGADIVPQHMVNVSEGGICAALWRMSCEAGCGFEAELTRIPILQETIELANYYEIDPYRMESAGCLLALFGAGQKEPWIRLEEKGFPARRIGQMMPGQDRILVNRGERQSLGRPEADALLPLLG